jgi:hypothetical protein
VINDYCSVNGYNFDFDDPDYDHKNDKMGNDHIFKELKASTHVSAKLLYDLTDFKMKSEVFINRYMHYTKNETLIDAGNMLITIVLNSISVGRPWLRTDKTMGPLEQDMLVSLMVNSSIPIHVASTSKATIEVCRNIVQHHREKYG